MRDRRLRARPAARARLRRRGRDLVIGRRLGAHPAADRAARGRRRGLRRARLRRGRRRARPARLVARRASRSSRRSCSSASCRARSRRSRSTISEFLPFAPAARAFGATLFDAAPLSTALAASGHLAPAGRRARRASRWRSSAAFRADERRRAARARAPLTCASGTSCRDPCRDRRRPARRAPTAGCSARRPRACSRRRRAPGELVLQPAEQRRERGAVGLVQPILERARQGVQIAGRERVHEQRRALQAVDGVGARHLGPQRLRDSVVPSA